jgi:16S rRNA (cytosine1402-N4)-methyltransferase
MNQPIYHKPVLLQTILDIFDPQPGQMILDATLGGGGHTLALAKRGVQVLAFDQDQAAIDHFSGHTNVKLFHANFDQIDQILSDQIGQLDAVLFDLGVSSYQLDTPARGFSFQIETPLDMRMDQQLSVTAADLVNALSVKELTHLFQLYAKPRWARPVAKAIISARPIKTTTQLARVIESTIHEKRGRIHPATTFFQALRIAVNSELDSLKKALPTALELLKSGGKLAVIAFHQGEDKIVKDFFKEHINQLQIMTKKPITPNQQELALNPRARSAKLRVAQKL